MNRYFYSIVIFLVIVGSAAQVLYLQVHHHLGAAVADALVSVGGFWALSAGFRYTSRFLRFDRNNIAYFFISHIVAALVITAVWLGIVFSVIEGLQSAQLIPDAAFYPVWRFVIGLIAYTLMIAVYYIISYSEDLLKQEKKEAEYQTMISEAELKMLKLQIHPRFIFNSLNSITALIDIDTASARDMTIKLADFLRYALSTKSKSFVPLREELDNIRKYLSIEKIRFEDRFEYSEIVQNDCQEIPVPAMILQPLFENTLKHAVYNALEKVSVAFEAGRTGDGLKMVLRNTLEEASPVKGTGTGLENVRHRLQILYGESAMMEISSAEGVFTVSIIIPGKYDGSV